MHHTHLSIPNIFRFLMAIACALSMSGLSASPAEANGFCTVMNNLDSGASSLREKIGLASCSMIDFDGDHAITLTSALPDRSHQATIS